MEFDLLTNGMISNYPKKIYGSVFKVRHWRDLGIASEEGFLDVLVECLDNTVDFTKTEFIKTTSQLTTQDIMYLFFQQRIACVGDKVDAFSTCEKCHQKTPIKISMKDIKEVKLTQPVEIQEEFGIKLRIPKYADIKHFSKMSKEYIEKGEGKYLTKDADGKSIFQKNIAPLLIMMTFIDRDFTDIDQFMDYILDLEGPVLQYFDKLNSIMDHGFTGSTSVKCKFCAEEDVIEIPTDPKFFLES